MKWTLFIFLALTGVRCREKFNLFHDTPASGFLVVEAFINYGGETFVNLSRTSTLAERKIIYEKGATVQIVGEDNTLFTLLDKDSGRYAGDQLPLQLSTRYRLKIRTANDHEYLSDYTNVIATPPIDSLSWKRTDGVQITLHSSHPENSSRYYRWETEETWEFHSKFESRFYFVADTLPNGSLYYHDIKPYYPLFGFRKKDELFYCWKTVNSSSILLGSTALLDQNVMLRQMKSFPEDSWELNVHYSILVKQYGISEQAYNFYQKMKRNTEGVGTIFDAQPSELKGNIYCVSHPNEIAIGFLTASTVETKRIFINVKELPGWFYSEYCDSTKAVANTPEAIAEAVGLGYIPTINSLESFEPAPPYRVLEVGIGPEICTDCRLRGSSTKPSFWP